MGCAPAALAFHRSTPMPEVFSIDLTDEAVGVELYGDLANASSAARG